ncbi:hypothetical protein AYO38_02765 [bacterium SCGC AG-212-C10]|nr:hypothetical protein AYO38_02765 [bacterium SCGC AG-212-C10]
MQPLNVTAVVAVVREVLETSEFFSDLWIVGEVSNYTRSSAGHRYFSLKDSGAVLRSVLFNSKMPGMQLRDGDRVLVHGQVTVYQQRGDLQFVCDFVRPEGVGILAARYEQLRARLLDEGLFDPARKRALPRFPRRIGVVTSPTGAALQDIKNVMTRRWPLAELILAPAQVQGEQAAPHILAALRTLSQEPSLDLAIVARGGGSIEDLWAFNDERVARAIYGFPVPVVSGVGHETDETIADLVADLRAPTPSAAVERCTPDIRELQRAVAVVERAMASATRSAVESRAQRVEAVMGRMMRGLPDFAHERERIIGFQREMLRCLERELATDQARLNTAEARHLPLDPRRTLARGFAIVQHADTRRVVSSVRKVKPGQRLQVSIGDGAFWTEVS